MPVSRRNRDTAATAAAEPRPADLGEIDEDREDNVSPADSEDEQADEDEDRRSSSSEQDNTATLLARVKALEKREKRRIKEKDAEIKRLRARLAAKEEDSAGECEDDLADKYPTYAQLKPYWRVNLKKA
jgi:hypothetical protein